MNSFVSMSHVQTGTFKRSAVFVFVFVPCTGGCHIHIPPAATWVLYRRLSGRNQKLATGHHTVPPRLCGLHRYNLQSRLEEQQHHSATGPEQWVELFKWIILLIGVWCDAFRATLWITSSVNKNMTSDSAQFSFIHLQDGFPNCTRDSCFEFIDRFERIAFVIYQQLNPVMRNILRNICSFIYLFGGT